MRIRVSWWWLVFLPAFLCNRMGKTLLFLFAMLSIHECAHMLVAKKFGYPLEGVILYPFGLCAKMKYIGMGNVWKEMLIILAGPATHLCFPYVFAWLSQLGLISAAYADYLCLLNRSILIFNVLPIFPLDGGRVMQSLYHLVFRYTTAQRLTFLSSGINLFLLLYYRILTTWSSYLVMGFLLFQIIMAWKQMGLDRLQFYHYRKLHPVSYPIRANRKTDLYRSFTNMMMGRCGWMSEEEWLAMYFHSAKQSDADKRTASYTSVIL